MNGLILFEDEHLLAINKPSGINTHKPDSFAPDGIHEWLQKQRGKLAILHRLDKDTSGVMLFGKTTRANQSLAGQFESHTIGKEYLLLCAERPSRTKFYAKSPDAVTEFEFIQPHGEWFLVAARPVTGKTHQIRRHAADNGFPIAGDAKYGGAPAARLMLHAHRIGFEHPGTGERTTLEASVPGAFDAPEDAVVAAREFRESLFGSETNAYRLVSGAADGLRDVIVDWYDGHALAQWQTERVDATLYERLAARSVYEQIATRQTRTAPRLVSEGRASARPSGAELRPRGSVALRIPIRENGLNFLVNFGEGLATGIFLDQRENRRRLLAMKLAGKTVLNCFAYTCAFSVAAAKAGAITTSIDLSRRYLDWGRENFRVNGLDPAAHEFLAGDVFEWLKRFGKRGQSWDVVLLDPPTFSTTKKGRRFQAARDYEALIALAARVLKPDGILFCSTNQRSVSPEDFERALREAARSVGRVIESLEFETVPFDFRVAEGEHPYLKTFWARVR